jgi:uncharacterized repeat protein (TIGR01451 family)
MNATKWILVAAVSGLLSTVTAAQPGGATVSHFESLQRLSIQSADASTGQKPRGTGPVSLKFDALGRTFDIQLEPNGGLLSPVSRAALPQGVEIYRGRLAGNPGSWARIVVFEGMPRGLIWDGEQMYAIEAPGDSIAATTTPVVFRLADTFIEPGTMSCGSESLSGNGATLYGKLVGELDAIVAQAPGAVSEIRIGAVGDFEFTSAMGDDVAAAAAIVARINNVDGIYSQEIGVQISLPLIETFSDAADPFSDESNAGSLLSELLTYRQNTPAQNSLGLTHLYTGRDLDGSTVGVAFDNVLCRTDAGAGLSEGRSSVTFDSLVAAHEIGHNFGAPHDGEEGGVCESEPLDFIMAPVLNGSTQFSQCSIAIMQANAAQAPCISTLLTVDMSVALNGMPASVLLSNSPELTVDLSNKGASEATNVSVDITLPNTVTFVSATASSGSCSSGAGSVNCTLGDVPGLSARTVTLTTTATAVGVGSFDATVTSDFDERAGNNQDSVLLNVDPAVDLLINSLSAATINLNQSTTINALLENLSVLDATNVNLSITLNNGLRADSASWSIGSCTVTDQQVDCQAASFAGQSSSTLNVGVTGLSTGVRGYIVSLSSNEVDADNANNDFNGRITVVDPEDEGGGAVGVPILLLLSLTIIMARRRKKAS